MTGQISAFSYFSAKCLLTGLQIRVTLERLYRNDDVGVSVTEILR